MEDKKEYVQILVSTLEKQNEVLQQIMKITERQAEIAGREPFDEQMLNDTLDQKEMLIARLNQLDDGFATVFGRVRTEINENRDYYAEQLRRIQELIRKSTDIGNALRVLEQRNYDRLVGCFAGKKREYEGRQTAANVASRYHRTMYHLTDGGSRYFNEKN